MIRLRPRRFHVFITTIVVSFLTGCATPDRWDIFEPDPEEKPETTAVERSEVTVSEVAIEAPPPEPLPAGPLELSLEGAVMMTLERNPDLRIQELNPVIAGAFEQIQRGVFDPELFVDFAYAETSASETDRATLSQFSVESEDYDGVAGVRQALPTGTDLELAIGQDRNVSNRTPEQQSARVGLTMTQQLLRGFGPAVNLASIRQAEFDTLASEFELRGYIEALVADVELAYWNFVLAKERIAIFERSRDVARKQLEDIQERIEVGALSRNEAAAASAEAALREQELIDARSFLEQQRLRLLLLVSPQSETWHEIEVIATSPLETDAPPVQNVGERIRLALQSRPDLKEARLRRQRDELDVIVTRNGLLPRLELFANLGRSGYADTLSESVERLDGRDYDLTVGVSLTHFIGNRAAEARNIIARATYRQAGEAIENLRELIRFDISAAINELERARQQISASTETRRFREEAAEAEQERFSVGTSTALDVALAQRDLLASEIEEVEARIAYQTARIQLYLAEGTLLERRGLALPAAPSSRRF